MKPLKVATWGTVALVVLFFLFAFWYAGQPEGFHVRVSPGHPAEPLQGPVKGRDALTWAMKKGGYELRITGRATWTIHARVLHRHRYYFGWQGSLSPLDLALGWGPMEERKVDKWVHWSQSGRWYRYSWKSGSPFGGGEIALHSSNVHCIPATDNLKLALLKLSRNDLVFMKGLLVNVSGMKGDRTITWNTSMSREDTGDGACEIFYVRRLVTDGMEYR